MLLEKGENINFSSDDIEFTLVGISKANTENNKIMSYLYPIKIESFLLLENNTSKYNAIRIKTNRINKYSASPNSTILPPKARIIVKFTYYMQCIEENVNNHIFKIESLLLKDYSPKDYLKFINIDQSIIELLFDKYFNECDKSLYVKDNQVENEVFNLLSTNFTNHSYTCFEKKSILELVYSEEDLSNKNIENVLKKKVMKEDSKKMLNHIKINDIEDKDKMDSEHTKNTNATKSSKNLLLSNKDIKPFNIGLGSNDNSISNESVNLDENLKGMNNDDLKFLKKEINLMKEKISLTKSECIRLENIEKSMKENILNNLSKVYSCKIINNLDKRNMSFLELSDYKSDTEIFYQISMNVLKFFIIFFLIGYILTI